jgi:hypothetical protein
MLEGSQADIVIPTDDRRMGRIGSSFSLPHTDSFDGDDGNESGSDGNHHEDEIVEHLDVIGRLAELILQCGTDS